VWGLLIVFVASVLAQWTSVWSKALHVGWAVSMPFLCAFAVAYTLHPLIAMLERRGCPRVLAVLIVFLVLVMAAIVLVQHCVPLFAAQLTELREHAPALSARVHDVFDALVRNDRLPEPIRAAILQTITGIQQRMTRFVGSVVGELANVLNVVFVVLLVPVLVFYVLRDGPVLRARALHRVPLLWRSRVVALVSAMDAQLGQYVRGQLLIAVLVGVLAYVGYAIVGLQYALLLALVVAMANVIPYVGPLIGAAPALIVAGFSSPSLLLGVAIVNGSVQLLENHVISPLLIGKSVHVHPLVVVLVLLLGGELAGVVGLMAAMPVYVLCKVLWQHVRPHGLWWAGRQDRAVRDASS
jgi:predicted PurR-regulated permease PerM